MSLDLIVSGDFGQVIVLTCIDIDTGEAADISGYTTSQEMILTDPDGADSTKSASFVTDGSDGQIQYTTQSGDIDQSGIWYIQAVIESASRKLSSRKESFEVIS